MAVSVIFRLSRLNMLLSWPVAEDVGVVVGGLGGGDCGEGLCSFWTAALRPNQCRQRGITPDEQALGSHTSPVSTQLSYYKQQTLGGGLGTSQTDRG